MNRRRCKSHSSRSSLSHAEGGARRELGRVSFSAIPMPTAEQAGENESAMPGTTGEKMSEGHASSGAGGALVDCIHVS